MSTERVFSHLSSLDTKLTFLSIPTLSPSADMPLSFSLSKDSMSREPALCNGLGRSGGGVVRATGLEWRRLSDCCVKDMVGQCIPAM
jgi:hypothetical protein